jgi:sodium/potassium/calcium exchanger 6
MKAGSGSLAIGELIGAASFIVSVVVGSIAFIRPFRVPRGPFLRDVGFFTVAVSLLIVIANDGIIHSWEAAVLVLLYVIYVIVVIIGSFWERKRNRKRTRELIMQQEYTTDELPQTPYRDEGSPSRHYLSHLLIYGVNRACRANTSSSWNISLNPEPPH